MAYLSTQEKWLQERQKLAAKARKDMARKRRRAEVEKLPTVSQRVIGRLLFWLGK